MKEIKKRLFEMQDLKYRDFNSRLVPNVEKAKIIGIRTPNLRAYAKELSGTSAAEEFLKELPHKYFEENNLHAFLTERIKDYDECIKELERFLPFIDNWATCDSLRPKVFAKNKEALLCKTEQWLKSSHIYTVRFAIGMLMAHFLESEFEPRFLEAVAEVSSDDYYLMMMKAWYFATALAKQYSAAIPFLEQKTLDRATHNKTIQKAVESYRITEEQKKYLKTLKF